MFWLSCVPLYLISASKLHQFGQVATHLTLSENLPPQATIIVQVYPAFGPGKEFHLDWMALIVARNLIATWVICGFWDWFLYFSPLQVVHCNALVHVHLRNITVSLNVFFCVHWSSLRKLLKQAKLAKYKMNPQYPSFNQIKHDAMVRRRRSPMTNNERQTQKDSPHTAKTRREDMMSSGDNIGKLLRRCSWDSSLPSLGGQQTASIPGVL